MGGKQELLIHVNDAGAKGPITIDPFIQQAELTASDGAADNKLGNLIAVSGNTVVVGADSATVGGNIYRGAAYVFVEPSSGWANMTQMAKLTASDGTVSADFGWSVAISGNTVVVGEPQIITGTYAGPGAAYVFVEPAAGWSGNLTQTAKLTASDGAVADRFGVSVGISGNTVVVGANCATVSGNTYQAVGLRVRGAQFGLVGESDPDGQADCIRRGGRQLLRPLGRHHRQHGGGRGGSHGRRKC